MCMPEYACGLAHVRLCLGGSRREQAACRAPSLRSQALDPAAELGRAHRPSTPPTRGPRRPAQGSPSCPPRSAPARGAASRRAALVRRRRRALARPCRACQDGPSESGSQQSSHTIGPCPHPLPHHFRKERLQSHQRLQCPQPPAQRLHVVRPQSPEHQRHTGGRRAHHARACRSRAPAGCPGTAPAGCRGPA